MSSLLFYLFSICAILQLASCQSLHTTNDEMLIFATDPDPRMEFNPSSPLVWHPLVQDSNHIALTTNDPRASVSLNFQGSAVKIYCSDWPGFPPLLATFDGKELNITPNRTIKVPSGSASTANHTLVLRRSPYASNESFWNVLAFGITPTPDSPAPLATVINPSAAQRAYSPRDLNNLSKRDSSSPTTSFIMAVIGVALLLITTCACCSIRRRGVPAQQPNCTNIGLVTVEGGPSHGSRSPLQQTDNTNVGLVTVEAGSAQVSARPPEAAAVAPPPPYVSRDESSKVTTGGPPTDSSQEDTGKSIHLPFLLITFLSQLHPKANRV